ncbi:YsnF/AvaK domain-containing protein [Roseomonas xinghualingensis]|uniref:YsnF/AvaK domain-containing protein n=1 Tax=Roseomonas xinghualingensis TaxID=2986475 RepID=UPI0021F154B4|nr:YsnF/AvaK domain-containing protein [Roseomonas sp. SXEYE001]MCV4206730.1 YsnF/AvaK domain-containing protein [Roseomonas sp. SXEYE001]
MIRTITGLFDNRAAAEAVISHLRNHDGINPDRFTIHGQESSATGDTEGRGFWASLRDVFIADEDRYTYSEGIRRGGFVVTAEVDDAISDHAMDVFEQHGAVDLESREAEWRSSGWTGYQSDTPGMSGTAGIAGAAGASTGDSMNTSGAPGTGTMGATSTTPGTGAMGSTSITPGTGTMGATSTTPGTGAMGSTSTTPGTGTMETTSTAAASGAGAMPGGEAGMGAGTSSGATPTTMAGSSGATTNEERIPVVEEQLRVGKREMDRGRVRVRSYIVETPVDETVTLRSEHVRVERRPVDQPLSAADDAFRERTIEAVEHAEEAVVSKEARVKEELVIRKDVDLRDETISDTVRRTEVEVEGDIDSNADETKKPGRPAGV